MHEGQEGVRNGMAPVVRTSGAESGMFLSGLYAASFWSLFFTDLHQNLTEHVNQYAVLMNVIEPEVLNVPLKGSFSPKTAKFGV